MKISVALCTYNGEKFLQSQLDSILNQSVAVDEIVVCDDCSTDETLQILENYSEKHPSIFKIHQNQDNLGYRKNFEQAINHCTGELIFLCDQDDIWLENKVKQIVNIATQKPNKSVFLHKIDLLLEDNTISPISFWDLENFNPNFNDEDILRYLLFHRNVFPGMSMVINQKAKTQYLPLTSKQAKTIHDYEILLKAGRDQQLCIVNTVLAHYRIHNQQNIGFDHTSISIQQETLNNIYGKIKMIDWVKNSIIEFNLDPKLLSEYKLKCKADYKKFILNLSFPKNLITHLKAKYYYKILHELS